MDQTPPFAVITGASRGIGAEYARALATQGYDLLLVARDSTRLEILRRELHPVTQREIWTESLDLSQPQAAETLHDLARSHRPEVSLLINNAGFGLYGNFVEMPLASIQNMLQVHMNTIVESIRLFLPAMLARKQGAIITVASVAGFFPIPYISEYAATKAFLIAFSEGASPYKCVVQAIRTLTFIKLPATNQNMSYSHNPRNKSSRPLCKPFDPNARW
jgi:short-subunit dehydrogenase